MNDPQTIIGVVSAAASWAAVAVMIQQAKDNRRTPPPAVQAGPRVPRKSAKRPRRRTLRPLPVTGARG